MDTNGNRTTQDEAMKASPERETKQHFAEEVGVVFEQWGLTRMAGRVLGWLMVCEPTHQSSGQLAAAIGASKGSISTATRTLVQMGIIDRIGMPGQRGNFFRLTRNPGAHLLMQKMSGLMVMRKLAERGLDIVAGETEGQPHRLQRMRDMWAFLEVEMPKLIERYEQAHGYDAEGEP